MPLPLGDNERVCFQLLFGKRSDYVPLPLGDNERVCFQLCLENAQTMCHCHWAIMKECVFNFVWKAEKKTDFLAHWVDVFQPALVTCEKLLSYLNACRLQFSISMVFASMEASVYNYNNNSMLCHVPYKILVASLLF